MNIIIPEFSDGLKINWEMAFPIDKTSIGVHITQELVIAFENIYSPKTETEFVVGNVFEDSSMFDCKNFSKRLSDYQRFGKYKSARYFKGERATIFFDPDEADILRKIFEANKYTCIVSLYRNGERIDVTCLSKKEARIIKQELADQGAVFPLPIDRYFSYVNVRKVKIINDEKGDKKAMKKGWWILGAAALAVLSGIFSYKAATTGVERAEPVTEEPEVKSDEAEIVDAE